MRPLLKTLGLSLTLACFLFARETRLAASTDIEVRPVHFAPGTSSTTIKGNLIGYQIVDYTLRAKSGQNMEVNLKTSSLSNYFNVLPPGSETALFVGSTSGIEWSGNLPSDGEYRIRVYLMRSAARRNEKTNYTLNVAIHGSQDTVFVPSYDAKVPGTNYHATGQVPCSMTAGQPTGQCPFGVTREGNGSGTVTITKPDGTTRSIFFQNGKATGYDKSQADTQNLNSTKQGDLTIIHIGQERYEILDAVIFGG